MKKNIYLILLLIFATISFCGAFLVVNDCSSMTKNITIENQLMPTGLGDYSPYSSWGAEAMGVPEYSAYLNDILKAQNNDISELPEVVVAVLDTGIDTNHPWFENRFLYDENGKIIGKNFTSDKSSTEYDFEDINGHGTHCAGIICDMTLPNVKILPIKIATGKDAFFSPFDELEAMDYLIKMKKKYNIVAVNMSYGSSIANFFRGLWVEKIEEMYRNGILPIIAAGNDNKNAIKDYPSYVECGITVSAIGYVNAEYYRADFSNYGKTIDVCAPGVSINSAYIDGETTETSGTSMAAPHVAAYIALLKSDPIIKYSNSDIEAILSGNYKGIETLLDLGDPGKDIYYGYGMPILDYLIPQYISVDVSSNIESNALPIGYNIYFSTKEEFRLKVISHEKFKLTAIYFDNNILQNIQKTEYRFNLHDHHEIFVEFGISYLVNHWLEPVYDLSDYTSVPKLENYELKESEILYGCLGSLSAAKASEYEGFTANNIEQQLIIEGTEINIYYKRNKYKVILKILGTGFSSISGAGEYLYGADISLNPAYQDNNNMTYWEIIQCNDRQLIHDFNYHAPKQTFPMPASDIEIAAHAYHKEKDWGNIVIWSIIFIFSTFFFLSITRPKSKKSNYR